MGEIENATVRLITDPSFYRLSTGIMLIVFCITWLVTTVMLLKEQKKRALLEAELRAERQNR